MYNTESRELYSIVLMLTGLAYLSQRVYPSSSFAYFLFYPCNNLNEQKNNNRMFTAFSYSRSILVLFEHKCSGPRTPRNEHQWTCLADDESTSWPIGFCVTSEWQVKWAIGCKQKKLEHTPTIHCLPMQCHSAQHKVNLTQFSSIETIITKVSIKTIDWNSDHIAALTDSSILMKTNLFFFYLKRGVRPVAQQMQEPTHCSHIIT